MNNDNFGIKAKSRRLFLNSWVTPVVVSIALPIHAQLTDLGPTPNILHRDLKLGLQIHSCNSSIITVQICNNEPFDVAIGGAYVEQYPPHTGSWLLVLKTVSHHAPLVVRKGECAIASFARQTSRGYWCGPPWRLIISGDSQGPYGEYDRITGSAYTDLKGSDNTATSTPFSI